MSIISLATISTTQENK
ncbi:TPA: hypothetical protein ACGRPH_000942 [Escherichia coli]|nr:hypothetical protein [Escherichia coli]